MQPNFTRPGCRQPVQQLRQRLHVSQDVAGLDRTRKQGNLNLRFHYEVEDALDVTIVSVRRQTLQQDGVRHGVHDYVCGLMLPRTFQAPSKSFVA